MSAMGCLDSLIYPRRARSRRISSWDKTGQNRDFIQVGAGETAVLAEFVLSVRSG